MTRNELLAAFSEYETRGGGIMSLEEARDLVAWALKANPNMAFPFGKGPAELALAAALVAFDLAQPG